MVLQITSLAETLFVQAMCFVTLAPRVPFDSDKWCSVGGNLSNRFRKLFLVLAAMNLARTVLFSDARFKGDDNQEETMTESATTWMYFGLTALESFGLSFMCFLTPYLIQCQLVDRINIRPGKNILPWMYLVLVLNVFGMAATSAYHVTAFWSIKRLGDALAAVPVLKTLATYDSITGFDRQGSSTRKGCVMSQALQAMEKVNFVATVLASLGYLLAKQTLGTAARLPDPSWQETFSVAFRLFGVYCNWTRLVCHGLLLNSIDEVQYHVSAGDEDAPESDIGAASSRREQDQHHGPDSAAEQQLLVFRSTTTRTD